MSQAELGRRRTSTSAAHAATTAVSGFHDRMGRELRRDAGHESAGDRIHTIKQRRGEIRPPQPRNQRMARRDENEGRQEDACRGNDRAPPSADDVADERRGRKHRAGRDLSDGDGVQELTLGEPAEPLHEVAAEER